VSSLGCKIDKEIAESKSNFCPPTIKTANVQPKKLARTFCCVRCTAIQHFLCSPDITTWRKSSRAVCHTARTAAVTDRHTLIDRDPSLGCVGTTC